MQENLSWRGGKHPWLECHPSAGSIFKKIEGVGAGRLIDQVGLKGFRHGDAQISHIHANIMVNLGNATAKDVRELITIAQTKVGSGSISTSRPRSGLSASSEESGRRELLGSLGRSGPLLDRGIELPAHYIELLSGNERSFGSFTRRVELRIFEKCG